MKESLVSREQIALNPFRSAQALRYSNYCARKERRLVRLLDGRPASARTRFVHEALHAFIDEPGYSCLGAKSILNRGGYRFGSYHALASPEATTGLARDLCAFVAEMQPQSGTFCSFIAVFDDLGYCEESGFEAALWRQLNALHELDRKVFPYAEGVSSDPESPRFAFSFARTPMFVVGLHPKSSRKARRFAWPALVFNPHPQFNALREGGQYDRFKAVIRERELSSQGSLNPNLADFGARSEARQYAGRAVEERWKCPFHR